MYSGGQYLPAPTLFCNGVREKNRDTSANKGPMADKAALFKTVCPTIKWVGTNIKGPVKELCTWPRLQIGKKIQTRESFKGANDKWPLSHRYQANGAIIVCPVKTKDVEKPNRRDRPQQKSPAKMTGLFNYCIPIGNQASQLTQSFFCLNFCAAFILCW